jgi:hypothetical protein
MNEAIKLAIEKGGYQAWWTVYKYKFESNFIEVEVPENLPIHSDVLFAEITQQARFWQALGKAKKWDKPIWDCKKNYPYARCDNKFCTYAGWEDIHQVYLNYMDVIWSSGDTEKFWKELIK